MINFNYETDFVLRNENEVRQWLSVCIEAYGFKLGDVNYIFCDDKYLHKLNIEFLNHDTLTDIISFDYTLGKLVGGDIFVSVERVRENATEYTQTVDNEVNRVIIHGLLHFMGFKDKSNKEKEIMRAEEDLCLKRYQH